MIGMSQSYEEYFLSHGAELWADSLRSLASCGDSFFMPSPSTYCVGISGSRFILDPRFLYRQTLEAVGASLAEQLSGFAFMIVSHAHSDHFSPAFLAASASAGLPLILPDFPEFDCVSGYYPPDRLRRISLGQTVGIGGYSITALQGLHFRPNGGSGCSEYAYLVERGGLRLFFPGDVRDYGSAAHASVVQPDYLFSHVWFGDDNRDEPATSELALQYARYTASFRAKNIFLAHFYETSRRPHQMWTYVHAGIAADAVYSLDQACHIGVPRPYELISLRQALNRKYEGYQNE